MKRIIFGTVAGCFIAIGQLASAQAPAAKPPVDAPKVAPPKGAPEVRESGKPAPAVKEAREAARETRDAGKSTAKDVRGAAKETAKESRDSAKGATKETRDAAKDTAKATKDSARDTAKDVRDSANNTKDSAKNTKDAAKDNAKSSAASAKNSAKSAKETAKSTANDAKATAEGGNRKFNADTIKASDLGLAVKDGGDKGLTVANITKGSPLASAGFQTNDRILAVDGQNVTRQSQFMQYVFANGVNAGRVPVTVYRGGSEETVYLQPATIIREYETVVVSDNDPIRNFGIVLDDSDRLIVAKVIADSSADRAGIIADDEVLSVNDNAVQTRDDLARMIEKYNDNSLDMEVRREKQPKVITVEIVK